MYNDIKEKGVIILINRLRNYSSSWRKFEIVRALAETKTVVNGRVSENYRSYRQNW